MRTLLDIDNPVIRFIIKIFDCMVLSVLWAVFSLPIITMGAASTALYSAVYHHIRNEESYLWKSWWTAFKDNFKRSTLSWLPLLAMIAFLVYDAVALRILMQNGGPLGRLFGIILVLLAVAGAWAMYMAAYTARFQGSVKDMIRLSFYLMMSHPLRTIGVIVAIWGSVALILVVPGMAALLPAVACWISSILIEQVFEIHLRQDNDAEDEKEEESL